MLCFFLVAGCFAAKLDADVEVGAAAVVDEGAGAIDALGARQVVECARREDVNQADLVVDLRPRVRDVEAGPLGRVAFARKAGQRFFTRPRKSGAIS